MSNPITKSIDLARLRQSMVRVLGEIGEVVSDLNDVASLIPTSLSELINDAGYIKDTDSANFVWMSLSGTSVSTVRTYDEIVEIYSGVPNEHFGIAISNNEAWAFEVAKIDQSNLEIALYSIIGSTLYTIILSASSSSSTMSGTLVQTSIGGADSRFIVYITYNSGQYTSDKTYSQITAAHGNGETVVLITEHGTEIPLSNISQDDVTFSGIVYIDNLFFGVTYIIDSSSVSFKAKAISSLSIELEQSGSYYVPVDSSISLATIDTAIRYGAQVEILVSSQRYPYVYGSQLDASFGGIAPYLGVYVLFSASGSTSFSRTEIPLGGGGTSEIIIPLTGSTATISGQSNTVYVCEELSSLTISSISNDGHPCTIIFESGSTPTNIVLGSGIKLSDGFEIQPDTRYQLNFRYQFGSWVAWSLAVLAEDSEGYIAEDADGYLAYARE